jgi:hypothetical protein
MFSVDWNKLIAFLLPTFLRKSKQIAWLKVLTKPVVNLYDKFLEFRIQQLFKTLFTSQIIYLEHLLNDVFDKDLRRIYIDNDADKLGLFIYDSEADTFMITDDEATTIMLGSDESYNQEFDFTVMVPEGLVFDENRMRAWINLYRFAGIKYQIKTF